MSDLATLTGDNILPTEVSDSDERSDRVEVPGIALTTDTDTAKKLISIGFVVIMLYFWLYAKQARTKTFPKMGTLFGAFNVDGWTKIFAGIAGATPIAALGLMAWQTESHRPWVWSSLAIYAVLFLWSAFLIGLLDWKCRSQMPKNDDENDRFTPHVEQNQLVMADGMIYSKTTYRHLGNT